MTPLPAPTYTGPAVLGTYDSRVGLAVESMKDHITDEGWQIFYGLAHHGYLLAGHRCLINHTDVRQILNVLGGTGEPARVILMQDKREWDVGHDGKREWREPLARFTNVETLRSHTDIFKLTILKDAHQRPEYHAYSATEIGCHAWIVYYHPDRVAQLAPYVRKEHLIRTYHTIDPDLFPAYTPNGRNGCLLSGAVSDAYPLRKRLVSQRAHFGSDLIYLKHPGYNRNGCRTTELIRHMSTCKVAICTASVYGYALRKIIEATAAGCAVLTDLPVNDRLPCIDGNLVRIPSDTPVKEVAKIVRSMLNSYNAEAQEHYASVARKRYDYRTECGRLAGAIEDMRRSYGRVQQREGEAIHATPR